MGKFNWKAELKDSFKRFINDMYFAICLMLSVLFLVLTQTDKQLQLIASLIFDKDWSFILILIFGIVLLGSIIEKLLNLIWKLIKFIFKQIKP